MKKSKSRKKPTKTDSTALIRKYVPVVHEFDEAMWETYLGADVSDWKEPEDPVYCCANGYQIIADSKCVNAQHPDDVDKELWWDLDIQFPTQHAAIAFLQGLDPYNFDPRHHGFKRSDEMWDREPEKEPEDKVDPQMFEELLKTFRDFGENVIECVDQFRDEIGDYLEKLQGEVEE